MKSSGNLWFDREHGLPQITILGATICWGRLSKRKRGLEVVVLRKWRLIHRGFQ